MRAIPAIDEIWPSGHYVRNGTPADVGAIARWRTDDTAIAWSLRAAVRTLGAIEISDARDRAGALSSPRPRTDTDRRRDVYVVAGADHAPIAVVTIEVGGTYLELVYVDAPHRGHQLGTRAASVVAEHLFARHPTPWIGALGPIPAAGRRLLVGLGFVEMVAGLLLTHETWGQRRSVLAGRF